MTALAIDAGGHAARLESSWVQVEPDGASPRYFWHRVDNATCLELPRGTKCLWVAQRSKSKGGTYYTNQVSGESFWQLPELVQDVEQGRLREESKDAIMKVFRRWDKDCSGTIEVHELGGVLVALGIPAVNVPTVFSAADVNRDGVIEYNEFTNWVLSEAPPSVYYKVFCNLTLEVRNKRTDALVVHEAKVHPTDKVSVLVDVIQRALSDGERVRLFCGDREMIPIHRPLAHFGIFDGDTITALVTQAAPHVKQYFDVLRQITEGRLRKAASLITVAFNEAQMKRFEDDMKEELEQLRPMVRRAFDHHDTNKNGLLSREESAVFFAHYFSQNAALGNVLGDLAMNLAVEMAMNIVKEAIKKFEKSEDAAQIINRMEAAVKQLQANLVAEMKKRFDELKRGYSRHKAERDARAFNVLDVNRDGQLQKSEVLDALIPGTGQNKDFLSALGYEIDNVLAFTAFPLQECLAGVGS